MHFINNIIQALTATFKPSGIIKSFFVYTCIYRNYRYYTLMVWFFPYTGRLFRVACGVRYPKPIRCALRFLRVQFLDPLCSLSTPKHWNSSFWHMLSLTMAVLITQSFIVPFIQKIQWTSDCLEDILASFAAQPGILTTHVWSIDF